MKQTTVLGLFLAGGGMLASVAALAHHSFSAEFEEKKGEIHGVVKSGRFAPTRDTFHGGAAHSYGYSNANANIHIFPRLKAVFT